MRAAEIEMSLRAIEDFGRSLDAPGDWAAFRQIAIRPLERLAADISTAGAFGDIKQLRLAYGCLRSAAETVEYQRGPDLAFVWAVNAASLMREALTAAPE